MTLAREYARAIREVRRESAVGGAELIASVKDALIRRGHRMLLPRIFAEYRALLADEEKGTVTLRVASEHEAAKGVAKLKELGVAEEPRAVVDRTLIKGFVAEGKDFRYDASAKRALLDLYKKLTA